MNNLPAPANGKRECTGSSVVFGDTCVLSCNYGYRPTAKTVLTCQDGGEGRGIWSEGTISCLSKKPGAVSNFIVPYIHVITLFFLKSVTCSRSE